MLIVEELMELPVIPKKYAVLEFENYPYTAPKNLSGTNSEERALLVFAVYNERMLLFNFEAYI